jgi:hypothetical protein
MKTASFGYKKYYPYKIFSLINFQHLGHIHINNIPVLSRLGV